MDINPESFFSYFRGSYQNTEYHEKIHSKNDIKTFLVRKIIRNNYSIFNTNHS